MNDDSIASILNRVASTLTFGRIGQPFPNLDLALGRADYPYSGSWKFSLSRPVEVRKSLIAILGRPLNRLAFRSQPLPSQTQIFHLGDCVDGLDWNAEFLRENMQDLFGAASPAYVKWDAHLNPAIIPPSYWSEDIKSTVDVFTTVLDTFHDVEKNIWPIRSAKDSLKIRLTRCSNYAFIQRLIFNDSRLHSKSLEQYRASMHQIREEIGVPMEFDLTEELRQITIQCHQEDQEIEEAFSEALDMEWVGSKIPVTDVSTECENPAGMECIICRSDLTSPGLLTVPCQNIYHKECLEHWIHAAQKASHTCPYCRTELFPKPEYRPKDTDTIRNYEGELQRLEVISGLHSWIKKSADWFDTELAMQTVYELETGK